MIDNYSNLAILINTAINVIASVLQEEAMNTGIIEVPKELANEVQVIEDGQEVRYIASVRSIRLLQGVGPYTWGRLGLRKISSRTIDDPRLQNLQAGLTHQPRSTKPERQEVLCWEVSVPDEDILVDDNGKPRLNPSFALLKGQLATRYRLLISRSFLEKVFAPLVEQLQTLHQQIRNF